MKIKVCAFDAYGTLFDINSAARECSKSIKLKNFNDNWIHISRHWRKKQISYTWLLRIMNLYKDFWEITQDSLDYALELYKLDHDKELKEKLLSLYLELDAYPEVASMLNSIKALGVKTAVLSNGSSKMLNSAINSSLIAPYLDEVLSVESIKVFKPDPRVYELVLSCFGCTRDEVLFVSSNGWDICGASNFGFKTVWINRDSLPYDKLPFSPDFTGFDLTKVSAIL